MRKIENEAPMSWEAYQQATEIADTDPSDDKKYGSGRGGRRGGSRIGTISARGASFGGGSRSTGVGKIKIKVPKVSVKRKGGKPGKVKVKKGGKI
jgi:hypothetical protein